MEHVFHYMLNPGRVEDVFVIIDFTGVGVLNVPFEMFSRIITSFQNNYKACLAKMFIINASSLISFVWSIIKTFIDPITEKKIKIPTKYPSEELMAMVHPDQLAKQHGGRADLPERCWPPTFPPGKIRDEFNTEHYTEEELKKQVIENQNISEWCMNFFTTQFQKCWDAVQNVNKNRTQ